MNKKIIISGMILVVFVVLGVLAMMSKKNNQPVTTLEHSELQENQPVEKNIIIATPVPNQKVARVFTVTGKARVFENQFRLRVKRGNEVLYEASVYANAPDIGQFGDFSHEVNLTNNKLALTTDLLVEAFDYSAKDGSEIDLVSVPVR